MHLEEEYFIVTDSKREAGQNKKNLPYFTRRVEANTEYLIMHPSKNKNPRKHWVCKGMMFNDINVLKTGKLYELS